MSKFPLLAAAACLIFAGCAHVEPLVPPYVPTNLQGDARLPATLQRVAVLPAHGGTVVSGDTVADMDSVLLAAVQRQVRFEVVPVSRDDLRRSFGIESFSSTDALPAGFLEKMTQKYGADAVLFIDLTVYQPYRPISLGFRSKLATTRDVRLVWAFDEVFSAERDSMLAAMKEYYRQGARSEPVDPMPSALQSPTRFGAVAAELMFRTLPPR